MTGVDAPLRLFFCLPFAHSENLAEQAFLDHGGFAG